MRRGDPPQTGVVVRIEDTVRVEEQEIDVPLVAAVLVPENAATEAVSARPRTATAPTPNEGPPRLTIDDKRAVLEGTYVSPGVRRGDSDDTAAVVRTVEAAPIGSIPPGNPTAIAEPVEDDAEARITAASARDRRR